ncbi:MAG: glycoside hydrolase family 16 protein [Paludibacteraceae bacterium]|nr:glycoside hydrolase family 16 protein [Paludibacteraceae bacterium]
MKKTLWVALSFLTILPAWAQVTVDNFEDALNSGWSAVTGMGYTDIRSNAYKTGINQSDYVMYTQHAVGDDNYAGAIRKPYTASGYKYLHAYIYHSNGATPNLKVKDNTGSGASCDGNGMCDLTPINTVVSSQWQDVVWDISQYETSGIDFIFFMVDRSSVTQLAWMLVDEIQLSNDASPRTEVVKGDGGNTSVPSGDYHLVWADEFNGTELQKDVWNIEVNGDGGGNNELQYYCEKAVTLGKEPKSGNQCLVLTATKEEYNNRHCTSGRVNTLGKMYFTHGKLEASICFPQTANGLWPAFWLMGNDFSSVGWPRCGETDIIEMGNVNGINRGTSDRYFNGASHYGTAWNACEHKSADHTAPFSLQDGEFHLITCIWDAERVSMYYDLDKDPARAPYYSLSLTDYDGDYAAGNYFHKPNFVIFNLAVGGDFPNIHNINNITALAGGPRAMYVDYVRLYQKGDAGETFVGVTPDYGDASGAGLQHVYDVADAVRVELYDMQGRRVDPSVAARGIYVERAFMRDGRVLTRKIIR